MEVTLVINNSLEAGELEMQFRTLIWLADNAIALADPTIAYHVSGKEVLTLSRNELTNQLDYLISEGESLQKNRMCLFVMEFNRVKKAMEKKFRKPEARVRSPEEE
jgi:hypothetical protein